jgi:hypothetical protein
MAAHTTLWYFERFGLTSALSEQQRRQFAGMARMQELKRGSRVHVAGDPSESATGCSTSSPESKNCCTGARRPARAQA